jgi:hypothetical protein
MQRSIQAKLVAQIDTGYFLEPKHGLEDLIGKRFHTR